MTDKLILTTAQRDKQYAALENSIDAVTQEITDHKTMWGEDAIPSRVAQRQNLVLKEREHKDAMEMLQSLPMVSAEPVAWRRFDDIAWHVELTTNDDYDGWDPLYTSPQALTPISADDVTDEMYNEWQKVFGESITYCPKDSEIMAAAYNAVIKHRSEA
jgi:hypothetical protein